MALSLAFDSESRTLATGHEDGSVKLWDAADGRSLAQCRAHAVPVLTLAFAPDGKIFATASGDGSVKLWRVGDF